VISDTGAVGGGGGGDQSRGSHPQHARLPVATEVILVALHGSLHSIVAEALVHPRRDDMQAFTPQP
jgi:hypothetical protein